jgi:AcrR family transcriptional regulator
VENTFIEQYLNGEELDTSQKILLAALVEFGNAPVKNVGTRDIARRAGVNIAAISYYFKGKDGLYSEVINQLICYFYKTASDFYKRFDTLKKSPNKSDALQLIRDYISWRILSVSELDDELFKSIISIIVREELNNTANFKKVYTNLISRTDELLSECIKMILGKTIDNETARIMSVSIMGALIRFNTASESVKLTMGWSEFTHAKRQKVKTALLSMLDKVLS